ncbi:4-hydroxythreonine-4-phosphate dehydrogenase PdxA [Phyllobacterium sp. 0TCS1.6C]|jgi:4-hydroxy-L-threonine phosphate dehydrogenase PdxA|uniref:4-hydroxythreonine-4-phosphate dehydrogenase PdxA n=1 Tax=unclassified Phyllobacterium TaxID=2638441 RepID=UPI0022656481|nr:MULTISPECIES: 4-hydroxythreonine-4-phosphate dehydrogenase PdxA [unclassified Phyllobacterium]MCX8281415.1 4-hydroxythreonine-4-phosphate dehydrogenase PdxA [Phyllobacterium sp. 0TCS1.6C]MCX8295929.1 4-hydroxythreonine-4-phosphate dehydrogenase PdxA [Phyllobacterium sp. 0TCS1.6A]
MAQNNRPVGGGDQRPVLALAMGDPAGISSELAARLLSLADIREIAHFVVVGDRRILEDGAKIAGVELDIDYRGEDSFSTEPAERPVFVDLGHLDPADVVVGEATLAGGTFATRNFRLALELADAGRVDGVCFTPFNKKAMRYAYPGYDDEIRFVSDVLSFKGKMREFNVLERIWNARVTSHIPLSAVSSHISEEAILAEIDLTSACLRLAGIDKPRIAVAGLNPHAGDGGSFGREEIDVIEPAVARARAQGYAVDGPFPADTVFLRALKEGFHAVLTMYHDQGQIAMKMMGFDKGVTMMGGLPFPLCTPAHGTAYDIARQGVADIGATREAILLAARMAVRQARQREADRKTA